MSEILRAIGLIDEDFIAVYPTAAKYLGINKAVMIQELHRQLNNTRKTENKRGDKAFHFIDGEWWIYNSLSDWQEDHFPWLSEDSIGRLFGELEDDGLIKSRFVKGKGINAKWYTVDYPAWNQFVLSTGKTPDFRQNAESTSGKMPIVSEAISVQAENTTESKEEKIKDVAPKKTGADKSNGLKLVANKTRPIDPLFEAIAQVWNTRAGGYVGQMKAMLTGKAKKGAWAECNFNPPVTDASEILEYGKYASNRASREKCTLPKTPETIQRWFYDFRAQGNAQSLLDTLRIVS